MGCEAFQPSIFLEEVFSIDNWWSILTVISGLFWQLLVSFFRSIQFPADLVFRFTNFGANLHVMKRSIIKVYLLLLQKTVLLLKSVSRLKDILLIFSRFIVFNFYNHMLRPCICNQSYSFANFSIIIPIFCLKYSGRCI